MEIKTIDTYQSNKLNITEFIYMGAVAVSFEMSLDILIDFIMNQKVFLFGLIEIRTHNDEDILIEIRYDKFTIDHFAYERIIEYMKFTDHYDPNRICKEFKRSLAIEEYHVEIGFLEWLYKD